MVLNDSQTHAKMNEFRPIVVCRYGNAVSFILLMCYFFILPAGMIIYELTDSGLSTPKIPKLAFWVHKSLSPKYEKWANSRMASKRPQKLDIENISGTEWPLFGSVFYLWATESLQQEWERDKTYSIVAPNIYARGAIEAAAALVADPNHAAWVKQHWGKDYLHRENLFYRMLLIGGVTSYHRLCGGDKYFALLREQVETLSASIDDSPHGLLNDYPNQCYPTDVSAAIEAIKRADKVLGTDHSVFVKRSIRAFEGKLVDSTGLPPYFADSDTGAIGKARGCSNVWILTWAPDLWPEKAKQWYSNSQEHFWQQRYGSVGFREFPKGDSAGEWYIDVDSGPVIGGFGAAACAFGVGACRANGHFDQAYPLSAELIAVSWPLPDGTLVVPRLLSNMGDAPYLGEAGMLLALTRMPADAVEIKTGRTLPLFVFCVLAAYMLCGIFGILAAIFSLKRWKKRFLPEHVVLEKTQLAFWCLLVAAGVLLSIWGVLYLGVLLILLGQFLPKGEKYIPLKKLVDDNTSADENVSGHHQ
jgi:hypothetical protein